MGSRAGPSGPLPPPQATPLPTRGRHSSSWGPTRSWARAKPSAQASPDERRHSPKRTPSTFPCSVQSEAASRMLANKTPTASALFRLAWQAVATRWPGARCRRLWPGCGEPQLVARLPPASDPTRGVAGAARGRSDRVGRPAGRTVLKTLCVGTKPSETRAPEPERAHRAREAHGRALVPHFRSDTGRRRADHHGRKLEPSSCPCTSSCCLPQGESSSELNLTRLFRPGHS